MILVLSLLLTFCFDWEDISNTQDSVSLAIQTPWILTKILRCKSYFQLSSQCLDIPMKHYLEGLKYITSGLMLQFLGSNALIIPTNTSSKHAFYGVKGGKPLCNRRDRQTSIAWPNAKLISPAVNSALDWTSQWGQKLARPSSVTLNGTMSWPPVSIVLECRQFSSLTYLPSTTSRLRRHVLDRTRRGIKER